MLCLLLARANQPVPVSTLVDELWQEQAPASATAIVQICVSRLRKMLKTDPEAEQPLHTEPSGYRITVGADDLDQNRFLRLADEGSRLLANGDPDAASSRLHGALDLWRGPALADVPVGPVLSAHALRLQEYRTRALEDRVDADLRLGRHRELVAELTDLVARNPAQEGFAAQLMLALYRSGRQAEAADVYGRVRHALVEELGIEPGTQLRDRHAAVLRADAALDLAAPVELAESAVVPPCAELPPDIPDFTGRAGELAETCRPLAEAGTRATPIVVLTGPGGAGKTTLAVHAAHRMRTGFPDGQLYAELRGGQGVPVEPAEVLWHFLTALGADPSNVPDGLEGRQQLFRTRTADRKLLVVLDNAASEAQVRPLLPTGSSCGVLVTCTGLLSGLAGARTVQLGMLGTDEVRDLLAAVAGTERVTAEEDAARRIGELCGGLPLAVRVVGARLASKPHWSLRTMVNRLTDERNRLTELCTGDQDVRSSLALSYHGCPPEQRRAFRLLGLLDTVDFAAWTVGALLDTDQTRAETMVEGLVDAHLVQVTGRDGTGQIRYHLHDLLRVFARERLDAEESDEQREAATRRVLTGYRDLSRYAAWRTGASRFPVDGRAEAVRLDRTGARPDPGVAAEDPVGWLIAERAGLVAALRRTAAAGWWDLAFALADAVASCTDIPAYRDDVRTATMLQLDAARRLDDQIAEGIALCRLGDLCWERGDKAGAALHYKQSRELFERLGADHALARTLTANADVDREDGRLADAVTGLRRALALLDGKGGGTGDPTGAGTGGTGEQAARSDTLRQLALVLADSGEMTDAITAFRESLRLAQELGDRHRETRALKQLGDAHRQIREYGQAADLLQRALGIAHGLADRHWEAHVLRSLGEVARERNHSEQARTYYSQALVLFQELGSRHATAYVEYGLGLLALHQGDLAEADRILTSALETCTELGDLRGEGYMLLALGHEYRVAGRPAEAREVVGQALELFRRLGFPLWERLALAALNELPAASDSDQDHS